MQTSAIRIGIGSTVIAALVIFAISGTLLQAQKQKKGSPERGDTVQTSKVSNVKEPAIPMWSFVWLINSTDHVIKRLNVNDRYELPVTIGRTCNSSDYDSCFTAKKYVRILAVACNTRLKLEALWQEPGGTWNGIQWEPFTPQCGNILGKILHLKETT